MSDLESYRDHIMRELMNGVDKSVRKNRKVAKGDFHIPILASEVSSIRNRKMPELLPKGNKAELPDLRKFMKRTKETTVHNASTPFIKTSNSDDESDPHIYGGSFVKSLKHFGIQLGKETSKATIKIGANELGKSIVNTAKDVGTSIKNGAVDMMNQAPAVAEEALPVAEEVGEIAPLALAGGMKKKRQVSEKMKRRGELIKKIMKKYGCSLAEASKHIKEHDLKY